MFNFDLAKIMKNKKLLAIAALFLCCAVFFVLFHHHDDGLHNHDCAVCRFVQAIVFFIVFAVAALAGIEARQQGFIRVSRQDFLFLLLPSTLLGRSPPLLS